MYIDLCCVKEKEKSFTLLQEKEKSFNWLLSLWDFRTTKLSYFDLIFKFILYHEKENGLQRWSCYKDCDGHAPCALQNYNQFKMLKKWTKPLQCLKPHYVYMAGMWDRKQLQNLRYVWFNLLQINYFWSLNLDMTLNHSLIVMCVMCIIQLLHPFRFMLQNVPL